MSTDQINILVVDDLPENLLSIEAVLSDMPDITIVKAQSGHEGLRHLLDKEFALIFLDVAMPGMDGFETGELIRKREKTRQTPIVFLTATGVSEEEIYRGYSIGAVDYLFKPLPPPILRAKVNAFVDLYRNARALEESRRKLHGLAESLERSVAERTKELKDAEAKYRSIFENAVMGIFQTTSDGRFLTVNAALAHMLDYESPEELVSSITDIPHQLYVEPELRAAFQREIESKGFVTRFECPIYRKDRKAIWVVWNARAVRDSAGDLLYYEGTVEDITERKRAEDELERAHSKIIEQERLHALGQMASGIAHDFNNALMPILGFSELMLSRPEDLDNREKALKNIGMINTAARDAASIVSRLREFYRHREEGEIFLPLNLNQVIEQAISLTQPRWKDQALANGKKIDVQTELNNVQPISGCEAELREVLTNLIFNASDAMPDGGTITLRTFQEVSSIVLQVHDTGMGMPAEVRRRCLEPFFSTKGEHGTGLGLAMVAGIVRRHEGTITIDSEPGKGTSFTIRLPNSVNEKASFKEKKSEVTEARPLHILLVEDEPQVRNIVAEYLTQGGHTVEPAANGREGLERFHENKFDLVVTDRAMPEMSGDQLARAIKTNAPETPVILLTGFGDLMKSAGELPDGVDVIVSKPPTLQSLRDAVAKAVV